MIRKTTRELCAFCKGVRKLCGASVCPILVKKSLKLKPPPISKKELDACSEWLLVGEYGYPKVRYGPLTAMSPYPWEPEEWARKRLDFANILRFRMMTVYPFQRKHIYKPPDVYDPLGETVASIKPIDVELYLKKPPKMRLRLDASIPPVGGSAPLKKIELEENPKIPKKVESILSDRIKATKAVELLYRWGASIYYIEKIFSGGFLGIEERRRVVPTRWGITAVDSILGNAFLRDIKYSPSIENVELYHWEYLGNIYYIVLIPSDYWAMETLELWLPNSVWVKGSGKPVIFPNYEDYTGKPAKMDGGHFAIKISVLDYLKKVNRKVAVLAIRIITPRYIAPVGSWQIRESVKLALERGPIAKGELDEILDIIESRESTIRSVNVRKKSWLLKRLKIEPLDKYIASK